MVKRLDQRGPDARVSTRRTEEKRTAALGPNVEARAIAVSPRTPETFAVPKAELLAARPKCGSAGRRCFVAGHFCDAQERLGSDMRGRHARARERGHARPVRYSLNNGLTAEPFLEQEVGAIALTRRAQEIPRNYGLPRRRRGKERRSSVSHAGPKSRQFPKDARTHWRWRTSVGIDVALLERSRRHQRTCNRQKLQRRQEVRQVSTALLFLAAKHAT